MRSNAVLPAFLLAASMAAPTAAGADFKEFHKAVPLDPDGRVSIETFKGWIDVETWDRPEVDVAARIEPDDSGRHQAEKVRETEVRIEGSGSRVRIKSDYDAVHHRGFLGIFGDDRTLPFVRYTVKLPPTAHLKVNDYKSQSRVAGLRGGLDFETYKGRVEIRDLEGAVRLQTYKGEVDAAFARFAASQFETYKGDIRIALPRSSGFDLDADLGRHGDLQTEFEVAMKVLGRHGSGERQRGSVNGGGPELRLQTYRGSFRILSR
ncbi:MAG TPA: hypothetical protein VMR54_06410 [Thermoanaerobaculia bacterium]|nr:hypothetical protein [Thermoanaerobaculia bacterium]